MSGAASATPARRPARAAGFSLLELTLVVAILAVATAIAAPRYQHAMTDYRLEAAARRIAADLHAARRAAEQTSRTHEVSFDVAAATVSYRTPSLNAQAEREHVTRLADRPYEAQLVSVDFDGDTSVSFDGFGTPHAAGRVVIRVAGRDRTIVLEPSSGRASIEP